MTQGEQHLGFWTARLTEHGYVYVIQGGPETPIKIGFANDVDVRIATLQTGNPQALRLLEVVPGDRKLEWALHHRMAAACVRGEWFDGPEVSEFLRYMSALAWCMVHGYDGSGSPPSFADFDTFELPPLRAPRPPEPLPRRDLPPTEVEREAVRATAELVSAAATTDQAKPAFEPDAETRELWSRIAYMWIGGSTRSEIRRAEGLSRAQLSRHITRMRADGYELAEGITLRRGDNPTGRGVGKFRRLNPGSAYYSDPGLRSRFQGRR